MSLGVGRLDDFTFLYTAFFQVPEHVFYHTPVHRIFIHIQLSARSIYFYAKLWLFPF